LFRSQKKKKVYCVFTFSHSFFCLIKPLPWCFPYLSISLEKRFYCFAQNVLFWFASSRRRKYLKVCELSKKLSKKENIVTHTF
jgi:hypothetical protein